MAVKLDTFSFDVDLSLKEVTETGEFKGIAAKMGNLDRNNDIILKGAFNNTLGVKTPNQVKLLYQHDWSKVLGVIDELSIKNNDLVMKASLNLDTVLGKEVHSLMKQGALDSLSIGFKTVDYDYVEKTKNKWVREIKEVDLWEISVVTFAANEKAKINDVKNPLAVKGDLRNTAKEVLKAMITVIKEQKTC